MKVSIEVSRIIDELPHKVLDEELEILTISDAGSADWVRMELFHESYYVKRGELMRLLKALG